MHTVGNIMVVHCLCGHVIIFDKLIKNDNVKMMKCSEQDCKAIHSFHFTDGFTKLNHTVKRVIPVK